jgi:surface protein
MKYTNESIRDLVNKANDSNWFNEELNRQVMNADVSEVTDMAGLFKDIERFNLDISNWDVSKVTNMFQLFSRAKSFNQDISSWNVSSVKNMSNMFYYAESFNQNIESWDVSSMTNTQDMFKGIKNFKHFNKTENTNTPIKSKTVSKTPSKEECKGLIEVYNDYEYIERVGDLTRYFHDVPYDNINEVNWETLGDDAFDKSYVEGDHDLYPEYLVSHFHKTIIEGDNYFEKFKITLYNDINSLEDLNDLQYNNGWADLEDFNEYDAKEMLIEYANDNNLNPDNILTYFELLINPTKEFLEAFEEVGNRDEYLLLAQKYPDLVDIDSNITVKEVLISDDVSGYGDKTITKEDVLEYLNGKLLDTKSTLSNLTGKDRYDAIKGFMDLREKVISNAKVLGVDIESEDIAMDVTL